MKYLSRNKVYQKIDVSKNAKKIYAICEGEKTEIKYFNFFLGFSSNIDIIPIPSENGQTDPVKLKESAEILFFGNETNAPKYSLSREYEDEVWFVIDTDRWNEGNKIEQLKSFCLNKNSQHKQWFVAQSNPSFELWLYYHFNSTKPIQAEVSAYPSFKNFVHVKAWNENGFNPDSHPIEIETAIENSKNNFEIVDGQPILYSTEVHYLAEIIVSFVKDQLDKAKEMIKKD